jgi:hypothetical protein
MNADDEGKEKGNGLKYLRAASAIHPHHQRLSVFIRG